MKGIDLADIASRFDNMNRYYINQNPAKVSFKSEQMEDVPPVRRRDIYAEMPVRALGYTNELGEAIRPLSPLLANLSWLPAIGYIGADISDKYKQDEYSNQIPSKERASKQFVTQMLASVLLPTAAVKVGQGLVNNAASFTDTGLSLSNREKVSDVIINSMKAGEHKNFLDEAGYVNKEAYKQNLYGQFDEILKHRKTHQGKNPFVNMIDAVRKTVAMKPAKERVKSYTGMVVDRLVDERQQLLDGVRPENLSQRAFKKFVKATKDLGAEEKQSYAFDVIRKIEKGRMFNNRIIKSIGGLLALSLMAKPIDNFVENVIIEKYVGPTISMVKTYARKDEKLNA
ncbi:MAG: hypothetical protein K6E29_03885 [Cyanobacteria bacterium RUI128]|nr:hypothetical protein [Cyanobacteria bacterium RUI128]